LGIAFRLSATYGQIDPATMVWYNITTHVWMMECPDLFPLGNKWMAIGSFLSDNRRINQWFIGQLQGNPPVFIAENTGVMDFGNEYAAKTGTDFANSGTGRRIVFAFNGWDQPTANPHCGKSILIPRDITLGSDQLSPRINPIPELQFIHNISSHQSWNNAFSVLLPPGARIQINTVCQINSPVFGGRIIHRILGTPNDTYYTDIGFDFYTMSLFSNLQHCCAESNRIIQNAPIIAGKLYPENVLNMTVLVDGAIIESFVNGLTVLTTLVNPDPMVGLPEERVNRFMNLVGSAVSCTVDYWQMLNTN